MINTPDHHDALFKYTEGSLENAIDFIKGIFPSEIVNNINFNSFELDKTEYTDEKLKKLFSDLVYTCEYKSSNKIKIALLFEHKSYPSKYIHFQMLKYMLLMWEKQLLQNKEMMPIIPIVFYHGRDNWKIKSIMDFFPNIDEDLKSFIPQMDFLFKSLNKYSDQEIKYQLFKREANQIMCLLLKHFYEVEYLKNNLSEILGIGNNYLNTEDGRLFFESIIHYLLSATDLDQEYIQKAASKISKQGEEYVMTAALKLKKQGEFDANIEIAMNMLEDGMPLESIAKYTKLDLQQIKYLQKDLKQI